MADGPKRVVVFSSGGPGNFRATHEFAQARPDLLTVALLVTDRIGIPALSYAETHGIPAISRDFVRTLDGIENRDVRRHRSRRLHDEILDEIRGVEASGGSLDLGVLAYRRIIAGALFDHFAGRLINQHPADLTVVDAATGTRRYVGIGGLARSIADGVAATRTSTIFATERVDQGEIVAQGPWVPVDRSRPDWSIADHENRQKALSDWPALQTALALICADRLTKTDRRWPDGGAVLAVDGVELPYGGVQVDAPLPPRLRPDAKGVA